MSGGTITSFEYIFPILGLDQEKSQYLTRNVYGTAFCIGQNKFATAGHVITEARAHQKIGIGFIKGGNWQWVEITNAEVLESCDFAIFEADLPMAKKFKWQEAELPMLSDLQAVGYPYALDLQAMTLEVSAFKGHVIAPFRFHGLPQNPWSYKLSFQAARGLSGAPLCTFSTPEPLIKGIVIGNKSTEMLIFSDREEIHEGSEKIVERYEALQMGVAVQAQAIVNLESKILSRTLKAHLESEALIIS